MPSRVFEKLRRVLARQVSRVSGPLSEEQRARLLDIATKCPVHRTLESEIVIVTHLAGPGVSGVSP